MQFLLCNLHNANCAYNAIYAIHTMPIVYTMPFMQYTQCHLYIQCHLCNSHNANCAYNAIYAIHTMPIVHTMPLVLWDNAKYAYNAIYAIHTMPNVQTMPFLQHTQCQLCIQCHLCTQCHFYLVSNAKCAHNATCAAYLALDGCIFGIGWLHIWHWLIVNYCSIFAFVYLYLFCICICIDHHTSLHLYICTYLLGTGSHKEEVTLAWDQGHILYLFLHYLHRQIFIYIMSIDNVIDNEKLSKGGFLYICVSICLMFGETINVCSFKL